MTCNSKQPLSHLTRGSVCAGTNILRVTSIVAAGGSSERLRGVADNGVAPRTMRTLYAQVTFCGIAPAFSLEVRAVRLLSSIDEVL